MNNCHQCYYLEWVEAEIWDPCGYVCNKREYISCTQEDKHLSQLQIEKYRMRPKRCFVPKNAGVEVLE